MTRARMRFPRRRWPCPGSTRSRSRPTIPSAPSISIAASSIGDSKSTRLRKQVRNTGLVQTESGSEPGINGVLSQREFAGQPIGTSMEVPSVDDFAARVEQHGGKLLVRKAAIPNVAWFSVCQDSEANTFILVQPNPSAGSPG